MINTEENKSIKSNNRFYRSLINFSFNNRKIEELIFQKLNNTNKTSSALSSRNKESFQKKSTKKIRKFYINEGLNYCKSAMNFNKRKNIDIIRQKNSKKIKPQNENQKLEEEKISKNIFNNLDKIEKTLLKKYQSNCENDKRDDIYKQFYNIEKSEAEKDNNNNIEFKGLKKLYTRNNNKNFERNYDSVTIKSRSSINFFDKKISKTILLNRNNSIHPKRLKSTIERSPRHITRFLERKKINDIPVTYPLFILHNNRYNSMSEKNRVDRILSKLICLRTHIIRDDLNKFEIIKEFLLKNGFNDRKYFLKESLNNLYNYLLQPFSFSPEFLLIDVINEGINYKQKFISQALNLSEEKQFLRYSPKRINFNETRKNMNKTRNKFRKSNSIYKTMMNRNNKNQYFYSDNDSIFNKGLPTLIKDLETELRRIRIEKMEKLEKYNNLLTKKTELVDLIDKNKYIPNLCLLSKGFKEKYKENFDKINRKIFKTKDKMEKLKEINNRLYYDIIRRHNLAEFDRNDIKKKFKLTEFVVMERAKKKFLFESAKNNYVTILKKIKLYKTNKSK